MQNINESNMMQMLRKLAGEYKPLLSNEDISEIKSYANLEQLTDETIRANEFEAKNFLDGIRTCKACSNASTCQSVITGYVPVLDSKGRIAYRPCNRYAAYKNNRQIELMLGEANIPQVYQLMSFESFDSNRIKGGKWLMERCRRVLTYVEPKKVMEALQGEKRGLYFTGPTGIGKTHLAVSILKEWIKSGRSGAFSTVPLLLQSLRKGYENNSYDERLEMLLSVDLLVLDDFGTERSNPWTNEQLFTLINGRHVRCKATLFTSNLSIEETEQRLGNDGTRICSRILGMCDVIVMNGKDMRIYGQ